MMRAGVGGTKLIRKFSPNSLAWPDSHLKLLLSCLEQMIGKQKFSYFIRLEEEGGGGGR